MTQLNRKFINKQTFSFKFIVLLQVLYFVLFISIGYMLSTILHVFVFIFQSLNQVGGKKMQK